MIADSLDYPRCMARWTMALAISAFFIAWPQYHAVAQKATPVVPGIKPETSQLVVAVADSWTAFRGKMQCYERSGKAAWRPVFTKPIAVLLGRNGLAWGKGVLCGSGSRIKREGDGCAPAGVFRIGRVYGEAAELLAGARYPYHRVTSRDAWVDDPENPLYNRHVRIDPGEPVPAWFEKERMRLGDPAYHWLIEIRHNSDPPTPGFGSAIFFHTRRGLDRPTAGCTAMARGDLEQVIRFLRTSADPHYVLMPAGEYAKYRKLWGLPASGE
ncbi:MAG: L,D-transpeptidase family protein [Verrucomicrobiales bacterium]